MAKVAEKIPDWVERLLVPTLESKVRSIVREDVASVEKALSAHFDRVDSEIRRVGDKVGSLERSLDEKFGVLEKSIDRVGRRLQ